MTAAFIAFGCVLALSIALRFCKHPSHDVQIKNFGAAGIVGCMAVAGLCFWAWVSILATGWIASLGDFQPSLALLALWMGAWETVRWKSASKLYQAFRVVSWEEQMATIKKREAWRRNLDRVCEKALAEIVRKDAA